jgi:hypothetical protein
LISIQAVIAGSGRLLNVADREFVRGRPSAAISLSDGQLVIMSGLAAEVGSEARVAIAQCVTGAEW